MTSQTTTLLNISAHKFHLRYLKHICLGISRKKSGTSFRYYDEDGHLITDVDVLTRIKSLVLPPAWQNVWISPFENTHLQATGFDAKGRKQYKYHPLWTAKQSENKFSKLADFARMVPVLTKAIEGDLRRRALTKEKVVALAIDIMSKSYIRVGNQNYARQYGSYGLTTLQNRHVKINGDTIKFLFKGKKGVIQELELHDKKLARIVKSCKDIPGHELFQYFDDEGRHHVIDSGDVNMYLHTVCGEGFSAKDFRTWAGTMHAFTSFAHLPVPQTDSKKKEYVNDVIKQVSHLLGNTAAVCRKYYVHPHIIESFGTGELQRFYKQYTESDTRIANDEREDELLVAFLEKA